MSCERWEKHALGNWMVEFTSKAMSNDFTISNPFPSFLVFFGAFVEREKMQHVWFAFPKTRKGAAKN